MKKKRRRRKKKEMSVCKYPTYSNCKYPICETHLQAMAKSGGTG